MKKLLLVILVAMFSCLSTINAQEGVLKADKSREFMLRERYLNFPVKNGADKRLISLVIDGKVIREFDIELAPDEADFWVFLDVRKFGGKKRFCV